MLLFKNKTKTISQIKINKKKSKILRNSIIAIGLSFIGFSFFAGMKIDNINNIISHNETVIASISNDKDAINTLFSQEYTDDMFQKDLKNFEIMNIKNKETTGMFPFQQITILQKYNKNINSEEYLNSLIKEHSNRITEQVKVSQRVPYALLRIGFTPVSQYIYSDLNKAFKYKYNNNSFFDTFILKASYSNLSYDDKNSETKADFDKKDREITQRLKVAYDNKDYKTLRLYFKQFHEYMEYVDKFKHSPISISAIRESNYSDSIISYGVYEKYLSYKYNKKPEKLERVEKDIALSRF